MKIRLDTDAKIDSILIDFGTHIDYRDQVTHRVTIRGSISHAYFSEAIEHRRDGSRERVKNSPFEINLHADKAMCDAIRDLLERTIARDVEKFPRD